LKTLKSKILNCKGILKATLPNTECLIIKNMFFTQKTFPLWGTTVRSHTLALIASASGRLVPNGCPPLKSKIRRAGPKERTTASACDRVTHSSRSHALAVVWLPAGGTKGTSGALVPTRLR